MHDGTGGAFSLLLEVRGLMGGRLGSLLGEGEGEESLDGGEKVGRMG